MKHIPPEVSPLEDAFQKELHAALKRAGSVVVVAQRITQLTGTIMQERTIRRWLKGVGPTTGTMRNMISIITKVV